MTMKTTTTRNFHGTQTLSITTVAFSSHGKARHAVTVDDDGTVRVWDSVAGHFTSCHSIKPRVEAIIKARWAKAQR
jgi:WD40 repeat protein